MTVILVKMLMKIKQWWQRWQQWYWWRSPNQILRGLPDVFPHVRHHRWRLDQKDILWQWLAHLIIFDDVLLFFFIIDLRILNGKECLLLNWWNLHRRWDNKKTVMMTATMTMMLTLSTNTNTMIMMTMLVMSTLMLATIPGQILWSWCWLPGRSQVPPASPRPWPSLPSPCWPAPPSYHNHPHRIRYK